MARVFSLVCLLLAVQEASAAHRLIGRTNRSGNLGTALARWGDLLAVGGGNFRNPRQRLVARTFDGSTGRRIHLFRRPEGNDPALLGSAMAVAGSRLVVGVSGNDDTTSLDLGRAYLFNTNEEVERTFLDPNPGPNETFGRVAAASGDVVALADQADQVDGLAGAGSVAVYDAAADSSLGALVFVLHAPVPHALDFFGTAVVVGTDHIFVGAPGDDSAARDAGAVHVFDRATGAWLMQVVSPSPHVGGMFGSGLAVAAGDDFVVAGEVVGVSALLNEGRVHRFSAGGALRWTAPSGDPVGAALPSVAMGDAFVVVGSPGVTGSVAGAFAGEVALYDSTTGALIETIANPSYRAPAIEAFGAAVAAIGPYVIAVDRYDEGVDGTNRTIYWFADDTRCGNGTRDPGEACDDGNHTSGDGCDANCQPTGCPNGEVTAGEECDLGDDDDTDQCDATCHFVRCGDGRTTDGEQCDDGNLLDGDGCDSNCTDTRCGNGIVTAPEQCDTGPDFPPELGCGDNCLPFGVTTTTTTTTRAPTTTFTTTTRTTTSTTRTTTTTATTATTVTSTTTTTTATVAPTTSTTPATPLCTATRRPALRCLQETIGGLQIDCAGELVTPTLGRLLDRLEGLIQDADQAVQVGRARRLVRRITKTLAQLLKALERAEQGGAIDRACADEVRGLVGGVGTGVQTSAVVAQGGRP